MKKFSIIALFALILFASKSISAQEIGYLNVEELMSVYPLKLQADNEIKTLYERHQTEITKKEQAIKDLIAKAQAEEQGKTQAELQAMQSVFEGYQKQYQELAQSLETYREAAQKEVQEKEIALYTPVQTNIQNAINSVATKKGLKYVINSEALLFSTGGYNVLNDVKTELGVK